MASNSSGEFPREIVEYMFAKDMRCIPLYQCKGSMSESLQKLYVGRGSYGIVFRKNSDSREAYKVFFPEAYGRQHEYCVREMSAYAVISEADPECAFTNPIFRLMNVSETCGSCTYNLSVLCMRYAGVSALNHRFESMKRCCEAYLVLLRGLEHLSVHNIVHGDVRPSNIMWDNSRSRLVLIDYGFTAKADVFYASHSIFRSETCSTWPPELSPFALGANPIFRKSQVAEIERHALSLFDEGIDIDYGDIPMLYDCYADLAPVRDSFAATKIDIWGWAVTLVRALERFQGDPACASVQKFILANILVPNPALRLSPAQTIPRLEECIAGLN